MLRYRLPAEWEPQDAILLAWPHAETDWARCLAEVQQTYLQLIAAITRHQTALVLVASSELEIQARQELTEAGADLRRLRFHPVAYDDTWLRDSGPITLVREDGFRLLDFEFTGWGGKFSAQRDDRIVAQLYRSHMFRNAQHQRIDFALEGGAIESDGHGTLLTTRKCLSQRHPTLSVPELKTALRRHLEADRVLMLERGYLQGDDTDAHIDTLVRFAAPSHLLYQSCTAPDDPHYAELKAMESELAGLRQVDGTPYRLTPLPWSRPIHDAQGRRLAASYANFLIINGAVLVPTYDDPADALAVQALAVAFPDRVAIPVPCRSLIQENGSLHCVTMQLPKGVLAPVSGLTVV